jgi:hypothetical protein
MYVGLTPVVSRADAAWHVSGWRLVRWPPMRSALARLRRACPRSGRATLRRVKILALVLLAAAVAAPLAIPAPFPGVRTPTHNNTGAVTPGALHCDIAQALYRARLQKGCLAPPTQLDWHGFELTPKGKGAVTCSGGVLVMGPVRYVTLGYGRTWSNGAYICRSRLAGLTCTNRSGHGLFLSRVSYRTF